MLFFKNRIYVRTVDDKSKPFHVIDPDTLEIDKDFPEPELGKESTCSLGKWQEEPDTDGRTLNESPFFTDGNYFYIVSQRKEQLENDAYNL